MPITKDQRLEMEFQLWEFGSKASKCWHKMSGVWVKDDFMDMKIGEQRLLSKNNYIMRSK